MEYDRDLSPNSGLKESAASFLDSIEDAFASSVFGPTYPTVLLDQQVSSSCDLELVQLTEYPLINDPILNEATNTLNDELLARTNQPILQCEANRTLERPNFYTGHPPFFLDSTALPSPSSQNQNTILEPVAATAQQVVLREADAQRYEQNESSENEPMAAVGNNPFRVYDCDVEQILGLNENTTCPSDTHVSSLLPSTNKTAHHSPVQEILPIGEDECLDTVTILQSSPSRSISAPMNGDIQEHIQMSPEDVYITFPGQEIGSLSPSVSTSCFPELENVPANDEYEPQNQEGRNFSGTVMGSELNTVINGVDMGTEQEDVSLVLESVQENVVSNQTATLDLTNSSEAKPNVFEMTRAEKVRMVFLYPMYKQMKTFQKRVEKSRRGLRQAKQDAKYYAIRRTLQDLRENMEIAQKATVVSRQLQLERQYQEKVIAKEREEISHLRHILGQLAVGKGL